MLKNFSICRCLAFACIAAALSTTATAQQKSIEELFVEAECQVKEGMHASYDFSKNDMFGGGIDGGYIGATSLKVGFIHTVNEKGGFDTLMSYNWTKSPVDGNSLKETRADPLHSSIILSSDYFSFISHAHNLSLRRTYKNEWHGTLVNTGGSQDRSSAFVYPLVCKFDNSIDGPLALFMFRWDRVPEKLGLQN